MFANAKVGTPTSSLAFWGRYWVAHLCISETFAEGEGRNFPIVTRPGFGTFAGEVTILTSSRSFSAAESLAYILQAHDRARVIGAATAGGANPMGHFKVTEEVTLAIPTGSPVIFATESNWEGCGVQPDRVVDTALSGQEVLRACI